MNLRARVALELLLGRSSTIFERVTDDVEFITGTGLDLRATPYVGWSRLPLSEFLRAAERAAAGEHAIVEDFSGKSVRVHLDQHTILATRESDDGSEDTIAPPDLQFLSPDRDTRLRALSAIVAQYGATGPKEARWRPVLEQRPSNASEIESLYSEINGSAPQWHDRIRGKIEALEMRARDLVPDARDYYLQLCGPLPVEHGTDEWIRGPLAEHRRALVKADLVTGLTATLPGSIRYDLGPIALVSAIGDEQLWSAIQALPPLDDPFSLLGLLEIALHRRERHGGFGELANEIISKLLAEPFRRPDGTDLSALYPALVGLSVRGLRRTEGLASAPPSWLRFCAFTHAGHLLSIFSDLEFEPEQMVAWVSRQQEPVDVIAEVLGCRTDPMWTAEFLTGPKIRAEVIGRLHLLRDQEEKAGRGFLWRNELEAATEDLLRRGLYPYLPGPLEAHHRPRSYAPDRKAPEEAAEKVGASLRNDPRTASGWLYSFSGFCALDEEILNTAVDAVPRMSLEADTVGDALSPLMFLALTASQQEALCLSNAVADRCLLECRSLSLQDEGKDRSDLLVRVLFAASTAQPNWNEWLANRLVSYVSVAPSGPWLADIAEFLGILKQLLPAKDWRFGRADALARTAILL